VKGLDTKDEAVLVRPTIYPRIRSSLIAFGEMVNFGNELIQPCTLSLNATMCTPCGCTWPRFHVSGLVCLPDKTLQPEETTSIRFQFEITANDCLCAGEEQEQFGEILFELSPIHHSLKHYTSSKNSASVKINCIFSPLLPAAAFVVTLYDLSIKSLLFYPNTEPWNIETDTLNVYVQAEVLLPAIDGLPPSFQPIGRLFPEAKVTFSLRINSQGDKGIVYVDVLSLINDQGWVVENTTMRLRYVGSRY